MARPTKEEAAYYLDRLSGEGRVVRPLDTEDWRLFLAWLRRVRAALPSNAAVQRDRERRARAKLRMRQRLITDFPEANQTDSQPE